MVKYFFVFLFLPKIPAKNAPEMSQMNKSFLKFITDFGPLAIFFFFYYNNDKNLSIAIPPLIVATLIALFVVWFFEKKIPMMPLISGVLITFFGGLTIYFNDPVFIYIKPTIINIIFALSLLFGKYFTKEPVLKKIMGKAISLTDLGWELLNRRWVFFFFGGVFGGEHIPSPRRARETYPVDGICCGVGGVRGGAGARRARVAAKKTAGIMLGGLVGRGLAAPRLA